MFGVEQFEQLDSQKSGKLPLKTLRAHFKLDLSEEGDEGIFCIQIQFI